jgi:hypothetical protein
MARGTRRTAMKPRYKKFLYLLVAATVVTSTAVADEKESMM